MYPTKWQFCWTPTWIDHGEGLYTNSWAPVFFSDTVAGKSLETNITYTHVYIYTCIFMYMFTGFQDAC